MIRSYALAAAAGLAVFSSINAWSADPLPTETHKSLPLELAVEAAQAAIAACKAQGYNVTVTVADCGGMPIMVLVGDGARYLTREVTRRRVYTAALWKISTAEFTKRYPTPTGFNPIVFDPQLVAGQGGVPIISPPAWTCSW